MIPRCKQLFLSIQLNRDLFSIFLCYVTPILHLTALFSHLSSSSSHPTCFLSFFFFFFKLPSLSWVQVPRQNAQLTVEVLCRKHVAVKVSHLFCLLQEPQQKDPLFLGDFRVGYDDAKGRQKMNEGLLKESSIKTQAWGLILDDSWTSHVSTQWVLIQD